MPTSNYAIKPIAEQALRQIQTIVPQRLIAALGVTMMAQGELTEAEFLQKFVSPMRDTTNSAEEVVDLWSFLDPLINELYPSAEANGWEWKVQFIRESGDARFQHIGVAVPRDNTYLVVVVDIPDRRIVGYHLLDLGEKYGRAARNELD